MKDSITRENMLIKAPLDEIQAVIKHGGLEGSKINFPSLNRFGVFVLRQHFDTSYLAILKKAYDEMISSGELKRSEFHKTEVRFRGEHIFSQILQNQQFLMLSRQFFDGKTGLDFMRLIKKDKSDHEPVFLHQDSGYQVGGYDAYSLFIPLTSCVPGNGALAMYPGTKNFGHLGDVGGIAQVLPPNYPYLQPSVNPGDVLIMHAGTWHYSTENRLGSERIYLEVNIRPAKDPGTKVFFDNTDDREWVLNVGVSDLFVSSREQRIKSLYQEISMLKRQLSSALNETK
jgi:hypothetical protein